MPTSPGIAVEAGMNGDEKKPRSFDRGLHCDATGGVSIAVAPARGTAAAGPAVAAAAGAGPVLAGLGLVDGQGAAAHLAAVESVDRLLAALAHLDEAEAAGAARFLV